MSAWRRHRHRVHWVALFALACIVEWAAQQVKEWSGGKLVAPPPEKPAASDEGRTP